MKAIKGTAKKSTRIKSGERKTRGRRKSVRLDVATPFELHKVNLRPAKGKGYIDHGIVRGMILNISGSGMLSAIDTKLKVNSYVALTLEFEGMGEVNNILGKVKRVEKLEYSEYLTGMEFVNPDSLLEKIPPTAGEILNNELNSFNEKVQHMILKYTIQQSKRSHAQGESR